MRETIVVAMLATGLLPAQDLDLQAKVKDVLQYAGVENPAADDVSGTTERWSKAQHPGLVREEWRGSSRSRHACAVPRTACSIEGCPPRSPAVSNRARASGGRVPAIDCRSEIASRTSQLELEEPHPAWRGSLSNGRGR